MPPPRPCGPPSGLWLRPWRRWPTGHVLRSIHLSSLDPGVGKTTTVIFFLRALLASKAHEDVAALVCVRRKDQIEAIVKEADLDAADFAVLTAMRR